MRGVGIKPKVPKGTPLPERIKYWSEVDERTGCWLWLGVLDHGGYGRLVVNRRSTSAHRASYEAFIGPIPDGMTVDHLCFVAHCTNPDHFRLLSNKANATRQRKALSPTCARGHVKTPETFRVRTRHGKSASYCVTCADLRAAKKRAQRKSAREAARP